MPFAKYSVDPERIEAMRAAFHRVCDVLQLDCGTEDRMTERIVMKIVEAGAPRTGAANEGAAVRAS